MATNIPPTTRGPVHAVPCPFCGKANDFSDDMQGYQGQQFMDTKDEPICDHCGNVMQIVSIQHVTIVSVRQHKMRRAQHQQQVQQQNKPGFIQKLLGKG